MGHRILLIMRKRSPAVGRVRVPPGQNSFSSCRPADVSAAGLSLERSGFPTRRRISNDRAAPENFSWSMDLLGYLTTTVERVAAFFSLWKNIDSLAVNRINARIECDLDF